MIEENNNQANNQEQENNQPPKPMTPAERKKYIEELKKKKEAEIKAKKKKEKEAAKSKNGNSSNKKSLVLVLILLLVFATGITVVYFTQPELINGIIGSKESELDKTDAEIEEKIGKLSEEIDQIVKELPKEESAEELLDKKEPKVASSFTLNTPCYIVSHSSLKSEKYAKRIVEIMQEKGLSCGYYWIPDYKPNGAKFYQVYYGPYKSKSDARNDLSKLRYYSPRAYVIHVK